MIQSKQRRTYLSLHSCFYFSGVSKLKLMDVASPVAAPDASPSATVLLAMATISPPRGEEACRVAGDGVLECQQAVPLVGYAARRTSCVITSGWLGLLLCFQRGDEQEAAEQRHEHGS